MTLSAFGIHIVQNAERVAPLPSSLLLVAALDAA